ncbi:MAG: hypothetical protein MJY93_03920 [Fibrobacter sp.]|nr:hypothetical protein [Fibrobacter sp.]
MENEKKEYIAPRMEIIDVTNDVGILCCSLDCVDDEVESVVEYHDIFD